MFSDPKPLPYASLNGISEKTLAIHHDKLYVGYVNKTQEIRTKLEPFQHGGDVSNANPSYSELRALKESESFTVNGVYLHEWYFDAMGGDGQPTGPLVEDLSRACGSWENFQAYFTACGMAARGWVVLCWDMHDRELRVYTCDTHHQGGVWGCQPILVLDVYEHAYFIDYGADRKAYITQWWNNLNWQTINAGYQSIQRS